MTLSAHRYSAQIAGSPHRATPTGGDLTLDESWAPYAQATITCPIDAVNLELLDPRQTPTPRVTIAATQSFVDSRPLAAVSAAWAGLPLAGVSSQLVGATVAEISARFGVGYNVEGLRPSTRLNASLGVRRRTVDHLSGTVTLDLASDEALAQDYRLVSTAPVRPVGSSVRGAVQYALAQIGAHLSPGTADGTVSTEAMTWEPGVSAWDYMSPLVQAAGLRLWCDESRVWRLTDPLAPSGGALALSASTLKVAEESMDRDSDWYDAVVIRYQWTDSAGTTQIRYDVAARGTPTAVRRVEIDRPYPGPGAAAAMLTRAVGRGRVLAVTAVSNYTVRPGDILSLTLPSTPIQTGLVSRVQWSLDDDTMQARSRDLIDTPATAWVFLPPDESWQDSPPGESWLDEGI